MKVFVKISEHKSGNTAAGVYPLIDWIKQSFTWIMRLGCVLIIHPDNLTFKALLWRVTRARIKTQHSFFVTRALMINSPISLGREDWTGVSRPRLLLLNLNHRKKAASDILPNMNCKPISVMWSCESVSQPERDVFAGLVMVLDKNLPWLIYKSPHSLFRNHWKIYHHPVKPQGRWPFQSYFVFFASLLKMQKVQLETSKLILINVHLNVVNSMYSPGCLQVENWFCCILIEWLV